MGSKQQSCPKQPQHFAVLRCPSSLSGGHRGGKGGKGWKGTQVSWLPNSAFGIRPFGIRASPSPRPKGETLIYFSLLLELLNPIPLQS